MCLRQEVRGPCMLAVVSNGGVLSMVLRCLQSTIFCATWRHVDILSTRAAHHLHVQLLLG
jgi:hypothetical protein